MEAFAQGFLGEEGPHFVTKLREYGDEAKSYWDDDHKGAALIRLDYIDTPLKPTIAALTRESGEAIDSAAIKTSILRHGSRWATLYVPELDEGSYRVAWKHKSRSYEANFQVGKHCTTAVEIDGFTAETRVLSCDASVPTCRKVWTVYASR